MSQGDKNFIKFAAVAAACCVGFGAVGIAGSLAFTAITHTPLIMAGFGSTAIAGVAAHAPVAIAGWATALVAGAALSVAGWLGYKQSYGNKPDVARGLVSAEHGHAHRPEIPREHVLQRNGQQHGQGNWDQALTAATESVASTRRFLDEAPADIVDRQNLGARQMAGAGQRGAGRGGPS